MQSAESQSSYSVLNPSIIGKYNLAATSTLLLWDILITLQREKLYMWSYHSRANWTTLFYIITRYVPFIFSVVFLLLSMLQFGGADILAIQCKINSDDFGCMTLLNTVSSSLSVRNFSILYIVPWFVVLTCNEILFIRRIVALHGGSKRLSRILSVLLICELVSALVSLYFFTLDSESSVFPELSFDSPLNSKNPVLFSAAYFGFPELIFQAFLVILIMIKVISDRRSKITRSNLISTVIRDGLWSYFFNLCGLLVIVTRPVWLSGPLGLPNILWSYVSFSVTSTRLVLNVRAAAAKRPRTNDTSPAADPWSRSTFVQNIKTLLTPGTDELSTPYHYHDLENSLDFDDELKVSF